MREEESNEISVAMESALCCRIYDLGCQLSVWLDCNARESLFIFSDSQQLNDSEMNKKAQKNCTDTPYTPNIG